MDIRIMDDYRIMESPRPISVEKMTINLKKRKAAAADGRLGSFSHHPRDRFSLLKRECAAILDDFADLDKMTFNRKKWEAAAADGRLGSFSHHLRNLSDSLSSSFESDSSSNRFIHFKEESSSFRDDLTSSSLKLWLEGIDDDLGYFSHHEDDLTSFPQKMKDDPKDEDLDYFPVNWDDLISTDDEDLKFPSFSDNSEETEEVKYIGPDDWVQSSDGHLKWAWPGLPTSQESVDGVGV